MNKIFFHPFESLGYFRPRTKNMSFTKLVIIVFEHEKTNSFLIFSTLLLFSRILKFFRQATFPIFICSPVFHVDYVFPFHHLNLIQREIEFSIKNSFEKHSRWRWCVWCWCQLYYFSFSFFSSCFFFHSQISQACTISIRGVFNVQCIMHSAFCLCA